MQRSRLALLLLLAVLVCGVAALPAQAGGYYAGFRAPFFRQSFYAAPIAVPVTVPVPVQTVVTQPVYAQNFVQSYVSPIVVQPLVGYPTLGCSGGYGVHGFRSHVHGVQRVFVQPQRLRQQVIIRHR